MGEPMSGKWKVAFWVALIAVLTGALAEVHRVRIRKRVISLSGAVIRQDADPKKQIPLANVEISAADDMAASDCTSDSSGFFRLPLREGVKPGRPVTLLFQHAQYKPLVLNEIAGNKIYIARMTPIPHEASDATHHPEVVVANVDVRYSVKSTAVENIGSVVKTFQASNAGNVPCNARRPCSPDGKWKAANGGISLDAGQGNEFRNARVSCIAGPCPFTFIESPIYSRDGRTIRVSALDWSDPATFLLEAEVDRVMVSNTGRESYPVTFGGALSFALPLGAEGVTIEAEMDGTPIVFPLGPDLLLSWADCDARVNSDRTKVYRCSLKPGYRFQ
jgi:hypothetical protein